jgi:hypothetical protein
MPTKAITKQSTKVDSQTSSYKQRNDGTANDLDAAAGCQQPTPQV